MVIHEMLIKLILSAHKFSLNFTASLCRFMSVEYLRKYNWIARKTTIKVKYGVYDCSKLALVEILLICK